MRINDLMTNIQQTTYGLGPFHPAVRRGEKLYYWPNRTFASEDEAKEAALAAVIDLIMACDTIVKEWNVTEVEG